MTRLWGGRFSREPSALMQQFNDSITFDIRLWDADIRGSIAYAKALARAGLITRKEAATLVRGLRTIHAEFSQGAFTVKPGDEDIHTAVERRLRELVGEVAGKLHTGRSRNDQVATDVRLFVLDAIRELVGLLEDVQAALLAQAEPHVETLMPGYTHLQRAQPISFAHWCLSHFWALERDKHRLRDCARRTAVLPLGSGALAGNPFGIARRALARALGFAALSENSLDAVSDRDFIAEFLFDCALVGVHLSRLAEDLVIYASAEFGFVAFDDAFATGSSLMPQKKNPDAMELARGKSGRLIGNLVAVLTLLKGLPTAYNKDLQEDKPPLFDSLDTLRLALPVVAGAVRTLRVNVERMRAALDPAMLATDVADYLVRKGVPFREAHHLVGRAVALAEQRSVGLHQLTLEDWRSIAPHFDADVAEVFDFARSVAMRNVEGGTAPDAVRRQLRLARRVLSARSRRKPPTASPPPAAS
ncbi:MAG: argininosuccinate lyase [Thermoflexales bacterium]|nr:argininosuccinate lyase [Thermoflexales bacterium]MCS7325331.1 argininosuccinate lyase [Thermoflexales bacterium]MCX7939753.1 argininosuccinate lyase [Thermoflexales bacterium]MDW8054613.1 argininosuccinate lyase [Anaerolineae bacterium]MDW8292947.1 argininosuccinate lyase [Anaerolineae bacterium]